MRTLCMNAFFWSAWVAFTATGVRLGCSVSEARSVLSWTLGRKGSAGHSATMLRSCRLNVPVVADILEDAGAVR